MRSPIASSTEHLRGGFRPARPSILSGLAFVTGVFTLVIGVAVVVGHNRWSGGALPIIVTLYGWVALIKGLIFLIFPTDAQTAFFGALHFDRFYFGYLAIALVIGGYLIYGGFKSPAFPERSRLGQ